jgi:hypothetical protein
MVSQGCGATPSRYLLHGRFVYLAKHNGMIGSRIGVWQISTQEGSRPSWSRNGRELFFLDGRERVNAASIAVSGDTLVPGRPRRLLETAYYPGFTTRGANIRGTT